MNSKAGFFFLLNKLHGSYSMLERANAFYKGQTDAMSCEHSLNISCPGYFLADSSHSSPLSPSQASFPPQALYF